MRRWFALGFTLLALLWSCQFPGCGKGPLIIQPTEARPGNLVRLHQERGGFQSYDSLRVVIGGYPAHVTRVVNNTDLDVLVPMQLPGTAEVHVQEGGTVRGTTNLSIRPTQSQRVVMEITGNHISLLRVDPSVDAVAGHAGRGSRRLSFDLVDQGGRVLYSGSIVHPLKTTGETFTPARGGAIVGRAPVPPSAVFWVRIPRDPKAATLRVYEAGAELNLQDPRGRDHRVLLDSLSVKGSQ